MSDEKEAQHAAIVPFRCPSGLLGFIDAEAAREGITRAEVVRRCVLLQRGQQTKEGAA